MKVLCVWEMGAGLGHLTRLRPFVSASLNAGYQVALVAKELSHVHAVFPGLSMGLYQAPYDTTPRSPLLPISWPETLLLRYRSAGRLASYLNAWRSIFDAFSPDLVVYDASPTALISSLGLPWHKWTVGSPFFMPRLDLPSLGMYPNAGSDAKASQRLKASEARLLDVVQASRSACGLPSVRGLFDILSQVDRELLTTVPGLDYFGARSSGEYLGIPASPDTGTPLPPWPDRSGLKVFVYLKPFKGRDLFLGELEAHGLSAILYAPGLPATAESHWQSHVVMRQPACMAEVCAQSDLVVHMGGSQTVSRCLVAGVPQLLLLEGLEQLFTAQAAQKLGSIVTSSANAKSFARSIQAAVDLALKGRYPAPEIANNLLDGSYYRQRVSQLIEALPGECAGNMTMHG